MAGETDVVIDDKGAILEELPSGEDTSKVGQQLAGEREDESEEEREEREEEERLAASEAEEQREQSEGGVNEEEREAIRARRRDEKHRRKEFQRQRREQGERYTRQLETTVSSLTARLEAVEQRQTGSDLARLDAALEAAGQDEQLYEQAMMNAMTLEDPKARAQEHTAATRAWHEAKRKHEELTALKARVTQGQREQLRRGGGVNAGNNGAGAGAGGDGGSAREASPQVKTFAKRFISRNSWYGGRSQGDQEATRVALALDAQLVQEGWDPETQEYWDELGDRVRNRLPEKYKKGQNAGNGSNGRPMRQITGGGGGDSQAGGSAQGFRLSAARVEAIKEAGKWEDPADRAKMIRQFKDWDAANPTASRR